MAISKLSGTLRGSGLTTGALGNVRLLESGALRIANNYPLLLVYLLSGRCDLLLGDQLHATLATPGQCLLLTRKRPCALAAPQADTQAMSHTEHFARRHEDTVVPVIRAGRGQPAASLLVCGFDMANPHPLFAALPPTFGFRLAKEMDVGPVIEALIQSPRQSLPDVLIEILGQYLMAQAVIHLVNDRSAGEAQATPLSLSSPIRAVVHMIDQRPQADWTVEKLAGLAGLSRSAFMAAFDREMEVSPMRYVTRRRMRKAEELLLTTTQTINQISWQCGFESPAAFTRAFRRHRGESPSQFRSQRQQPEDGFNSGTHWDVFLS